MIEDILKSFKMNGNTSLEDYRKGYVADRDQIIGSQSSDNEVLDAFHKTQALVDLLGGEATAGIIKCDGKLCEVVSSRSSATGAAKPAEAPVL